MYITAVYKTIDSKIIFKTIHYKYKYKNRIIRFTGEDNNIYAFEHKTDVLISIGVGTFIGRIPYTARCH